VWGRDAKSIQWGKKYARWLGGISETVVPLTRALKLIEVLGQINPDVLNTFPSLLSTLAQYDLSGINPRLIFTQGEMVAQDCRDVAKRNFNAKLFETYGSVEFGNLAFECNCRCGLHMITNAANIEFIDEAEEYVSSEEQGDIVVTGFLNHVMPLIRYRIGDLGIPTDEKCACGRSWPIIKHIQGRTDDYLVLPSGQKIAWWYFNRNILYNKKFKENVFGISQYQAVQERRDRVILKVVKGRRFNPETLEEIRKGLIEESTRLGENIDVVIEIVDEIPKGRTGKTARFISKII